MYGFHFRLCFLGNQRDCCIQNHKNKSAVMGSDAIRVRQTYKPSNTSRQGSHNGTVVNNHRDQQESKYYTAKPTLQTATGVSDVSHNSYSPEQKYPFQRSLLAQED